MPTLEAARRQFLDHLRVAVVQTRIKSTTRDFYAYQLAKLDAIQVERDSGSVPILGLEVAQITSTDLFHCPPTNHFIRSARRLWRYCRAQWPEEVTLPPCGQRERVLTRQEFRRLRRGAQKQVAWMLWLIYWTGMRPEEVRELRWQDVDETQGVITLKKFKCRDRRRDGVRTRHVGLPNAARRALGYARGRWQPSPESHVFVNRYGLPWTGQALRLAVVKARRKAGLQGEEPAVAYHHRHTFATRIAEKINDITMLADQMGHASLTTTRRYIHRKPGDLVAAMDQAFGRQKREK